eukprot:TRINITY_DN1269_c0_g1_i1.p1 TRINITY_DN1269_c0_g1~~TRINITY_DN1269_c0_g1_i1.p1  ORF type:complete len:144 (-),score=21.79 TRINITY_DN1269_c0_g1_i1:44-475(-)
MSNDQKTDYNDAIREIANAIRVNNTLRNINLGNNNIGAEGAREIANALKVNTTLTTVNLENNMIDPAIAESIEKSLLINKIFFNAIRWPVSHNQLHPQCQQSVLEMLLILKATTLPTELITMLVKGVIRSWPLTEPPNTTINY